MASVSLHIVLGEVPGFNLGLFRLSLSFLIFFIHPLKCCSVHVTVCFCNFDLREGSNKSYEKFA